MSFRLAIVLCLFSVGCGGPGTEDPFRMIPLVDAGPGRDAAPRDTGPGRDAALPGDGGPCEVEICGNELDDDCDGVVDDMCGCLPGETSLCYRGEPGSRGVGLCQDGMMVCTDGLEFGSWGACEGDVVPAEEELCDDGALDEDCDGAANEGCECIGDEPVPCGVDVGECTGGWQECIDGVRGECVGGEGPREEICNGLDDDCDMTTDEALTRACGSGVGECRPGTETCLDGAWQPCGGGREAADEACDGLDNDCDGMTDESLVRPCGSEIGECTPGMQRCGSGAWSECADGVVATIEDCNGLDDDCDGMTDETLTRRCGTDVGLCDFGTETCTGAGWSACTGGTTAGTETCEGLLDEDCDGTVDDGCGCTTGATRPCGTDTGECVAGRESCDVAGRWGACTGAVGSTTELCDGGDDDCDGRTDEGLTRTCGTDTGACRAGTETCGSGAWGACAGSIGPALERCDGTIDEDCDGRTDEGCACTDGATRPCGTDTGECVAGRETCTTGTWGACSGAIGPGAEDCDNRDDDCDTRIDESLTMRCGTDTGACVAGTATCAAGAWGMCAGSVGPVTERCDGSVDEDCDGTTDEGCTCTDGATMPCGTDTGECVAGRQTCSSGMWGACTGSVGPTAEDCDNRDDDCDSRIDESLTMRCGTDTGACVAGTQTCAAGSWGTCAGSVGPATERCDAARIDEDCDGLSNEGCACDDGATRACGTDTGECVAGTERCDITGMWGACTGSVGPGVEDCDNRDDDCDTRIDESLSRRCGTTDVGVCEYGTETCSRGAWGTCAGLVGPGTERCDAPRLDEDCDGLSNEGCACSDGDSRPCGTDVGECVAGTERCDLAGAWGPCSGIGPRPEDCDGRDDDCDSRIDEGACVFEDPIVMCPAGMSAEVLSTVTLSGSGSDPDGGTVTYRWTVTSRPAGSASTPASPTSATTTFFLDAGGSYTLQLCVTDDEGAMACCTVTVASTVPPRGLHVELQWDTVYGDADVHLLNVTRVAPDGWWTTDDCYYANRAPDWPPAGVAANPTLDRDDTDGYGPENITVDDSPASGTYTVGVHYFCQHSLGAGAAPGSGPTSGTVRIYCDGALIATYGGIDLTRTDDWNTIATVTYPACRATRVGTTTYGSSLLPASFTAARHCEIPCMRDSDCPPRERCATVTGMGGPRNICILR